MTHQKTWPKHDPVGHIYSFLTNLIGHTYYYNVDYDLVESEMDYFHRMSTIFAAATKIVQKSMPSI